MSEVKRYQLVYPAKYYDGEEESAFVIPADQTLVLARHYDALAQRLAEVEQERDTQQRLVDQLNRELTQRKVTLGDLIQFDVQQRKEIAELKQKLDDFDALVVKRLAEVEQERDRYKKDALVTFDCQVCSGALEEENDRLKQRISELEKAVDKAIT